MIKISAIIPTYNNAATLGRTLESIVGQRRKPDQIIVVDDGSTDDTAEVVKAFPEVEYLRQANAGVSAARNAGLQAATGDWMALCDGDDVWHPEKLDIVDRSRRYLSSCSFFFHDFFLIKDDQVCGVNGVTETEQTIFPFFRENRLTFAQMFPAMVEVPLARNSWPLARLFHGEMLRWLILGNFILPSAVVFHRRLYERYGGFDPDFRSAEESELFLRLSKSEAFCFLDLPLAGYRVTTTSLSKNIPTLVANGMRVLSKNVLNDPEVYARYRRNVHKAIARRYGRLGAYYLRTNQRRLTWENVRQGFKYDRREKLLWEVLAASLLPSRLVDSLARLTRRYRR
jgi:glycosyltransferase involved in cell wall biosynthesis